MKAFAVAAVLAILVLACWLAGAGYARLRQPLDRLHCVTFVNAVGGAALLLAGLLADGFSDRSLKIVLIVATNLVAGAAVSHVIARAIAVRDGSA